MLKAHAGERVPVPEARRQPEDGAADGVGPLQQRRLAAVHLPHQRSRGRHPGCQL